MDYSPQDLPNDGLESDGGTHSGGVEESLDRYWEPGPGFDELQIHIRPPETSLELLRKLGSSPFDRSEFPLIGFLATTYEKVSRYALERRSGIS